MLPPWTISEPGTDTRGVCLPLRVGVLPVLGLAAKRLDPGRIHVRRPRPQNELAPAN